jgi:SynChlorMet cassette protein ScmD
MSTSDRPIANPVAILREEFDDWAVLFNPDTADAVGINPVGVALWKLMDGSRKVEDLAAGIHESFSEVPDSVVDDVNRFVDNLTERGFVGYEVKTFA